MNPWIQFMTLASCETQLGVYHNKDYLRATAMLEPDSELQIFRCGEAVVPLIVKPLPASCGTGFDAITPYDFSGPILQGESATDVWDSLRAWAMERGIVSAFLRFHPFHEDAKRWAKLDGLEVIQSAENIVVDLTDHDEMVSSFKRYVVRYVKVAHRNGDTFDLRPIDSDGLDAFVPLYTMTMKRNQANAFYYFPRSFFDHLCETLSDRWLIATVTIENEVAASVLVLLDGLTAYYYLACSSDAGRKARAMNYLIHELSIALAATNLEKLHLGGGSESLREFKQRFGPGRVPYFVGRAVFDRKRYDQLSGDVDTDFFPAYRLPPSIPPCK